MSIKAPLSLNQWRVEEGVVNGQSRAKKLSGTKSGICHLPQTKPCFLLTKDLSKINQKSDGTLESPFWAER